MPERGAWSVTPTVCETALGEDWTTTWTALVAGQLAPMEWFNGKGIMSPTEVIAVPAWRANRHEGDDVFSRVFRRVTECMPDPGAGAVYLATNHADADIALSPIECRPPSSVTSRLRRTTGYAPLLVQSACSSGMTALCAAALAARRTGVPATVVAIDTLADVEVIGFKVAGAVSPGRAAPFSGLSDGLTIGEAAVALRVEWHPKDAVNTPKALLGFAMSCDSHHPTDPDPSGTELERAWRTAIEMAGISPSDIDVAFLHGTGTPANDSVEGAVCHRIWNEHLPATCSLKRALGHTMGCSGLLNLFAAQSALEHSVVPPTNADMSGNNSLLPGVNGPSGALDNPRYALCVSSGFGGQNLAAVVGSSNG